MGGSDALALHRRIRRFGVPEEMIEACAAARAAGDWRLACAAGQIDVRFDPRRPQPDVEDMLVGFAPDLVRWHLPRARGGYTTFATGVEYVLAPDGPVDAETIVLVLRSPDSVLGSQRLTLDAVRWSDRANTSSLIRLAPYHWNARRAAELRFAIGGSAARVPLFTADGVALARAELGGGDDRPALAERLVLAPGSDESWTAAGLSQHGWFEDDSWRPGRFRAVAATIDPLRLATEARRVARQYGQASWALWYDRTRAVRIDVGDTTITATAVTSRYPREPVPVRSLPRLHPGLLRFPADLELVWHGLLTPADLHPLVRSALFPAERAHPVSASAGRRQAVSGPADRRQTTSGSAERGQLASGPDEGRQVASGSGGRTQSALVVAAAVPVRVRCGGLWHEVRLRHGRLELPHHTETEVQRERSMRAFGGVSAGCFAVGQAWTEPRGWLPRALRAARDDLWQRMTHGGTQVVADLLDRGMDPEIRDSRGRTLLHLLADFDHALLLPRLLRSGARIDAADREGHTPLATAVARGGDAGLVRALVEAGADPRGPSYNFTTMSILECIDFQDQTRRKERAPEVLAMIAYLRTVA
ncbi:ankyrin repeat domain-containing protein [Actinoplanes subglobosus]|uniref:Ankyrin repeat domain-containing protein n=1 Tax=Actinoplanes subglobosus TaxID=1547892 RepID=A0ABV8IRT1_9ACTN